MPGTVGLLRNDLDRENIVGGDDADRGETVSSKIMVHHYRHVDGFVRACSMLATFGTWHYPMGSVAYYAMAYY